MSFDQIPSTLRVPGVFVEVDPTVAAQGPGVFPFRVLVMGQRTTAGTVAALTVKATTNANQAREEHGPGSLSHLLAAAFLAERPGVSLDVVSVDDVGTAATGTLVLSGTITKAGPLALYIGDIRLEISLGAASATVAATTIRAAINADTNLPVTAAGTGTSVLLTAKNKGLAGNEIFLAVNHIPGESLPSGLGAVLGSPFPMTGGATAQAIAGVWPLIAGTRYDLIVHPWTDAATLGVIQTELEARDDALVGFPGMGVSAMMNAHSTLVAAGNARNNKFECLVGMEIHPAFAPIRGGSIAGQMARFLQEDPARPLTNRKTLPGFSPAQGSEFTLLERDLLLHDGISTIRYDSTGSPQIERLITTYQETAGGSPDEAFLDVQIGFSLAFARRSYVAHFATQFPNHKVADDGTPTGPGSVIVTPSTVKADAVAWYGTLVQAGIMENLEGFIANTTVQRHATDPNRLEVFLALNPVNQLRVTAVLAQFER